MASVSWPGYDALIQKLQTLKDPDLMPVMEVWRATIIEGNRRGVLSGLDGHNRPAPALVYRNGAGRKTRNRRVPDYGTTRYTATINDNLTTKQYQQLTGPRLAPRGEQSRIIKNLFVDILVKGNPRTWALKGSWYEVRSRDGVEFLPTHFLGKWINKPFGWFKMPKYDLRPVRPEDRDMCFNALKAFVRQAWAKGI